MCAVYKKSGNDKYVLTVRRVAQQIKNVEIYWVSVITWWSRKNNTH